ncbi:MAG: type VI secretion system tip protein VgrG [Bacteroidota bacterium]
MPVKSPIDIEDVTLLYTIKVNGKAIKDYYPVLTVDIHHEINKISYAEITMIDGDEENSSFPISDSSDLIPGNEVSITAGYAGEDEQPIFTGIIVKQGLQLDADGYTLSVICKHKVVGMSFSKMEEEFANKTDSDILKSIFSNYGIDASVDATSSQQELLFQKLATDWDLVLCRADFCGYVVTMDGEKVTVGKPVFDSTAVLRVEFGTSIISFTAELNAEKQPSGLSASAWDIKNQDLLKATAAEPAINAQGNMSVKSLGGKLPKQQTVTLSSITPMSSDDLKTWADSSLLRMRMCGLKGQVSFQGNADVKTGTLIELAGVGKRYNGNAYVSGVTHTLDSGQWTTLVKFGLDPSPAYEKKGFSYLPAMGQLPAIQGLQVATVKTLNEDPASQNRIAIQLPSNAQNAEPVWARQSHFYATSGAGAGFLPEPGDEVIVGFLDSDPRYPVVLGSLYSNAKPPLNTPSDNNNYIKTLTTRSKLKLSFDDEKKIILIETPGGNKITLSDEDKTIVLNDANKNTVKMSSGGIELNSAGDIQLEAKGNISLQATGKLSLTAQQDVSVSGLNINESAQVGYTAKGNASAELSASGQTVVKGAIVMIN